MNVANHFSVVAGHANTDSLVQCPETCQDDLVREDLKKEGEEVEGGADVGVIGNHVSSGGVHLCQCLQQLGKPHQLNVDICDIQIRINISVCVCVCVCV